MLKVSIDKYRIVSAPLTGIGWVAVQIWNDASGEYFHLATFRSRDEANFFIEEKSAKNA